MGFFQNALNYFKPDKQTAAMLVNLLNSGYSLMQINRRLYDIPEVRTAVNFVAEKVASVPFYHARADNKGNVVDVNDRLQYVLSVRANPYQTPTVFKTHVMTMLLLTNNVFILPEWDDRGELCAIYPLPWSKHEFSTDREGKLLIKFPASGWQPLYYDDVIHLQRFPTQSGGSQRQAVGNYEQIVNTMQTQAVKDSQNSGRIAAIIQTAHPLKGPALKSKLDEFKELFLTAENSTGFGMIGSEYKIEKLDLKMIPLNKDLLESIVSYLYTYFGVSKEIITHTASELQNEQFVDNTIKPFVKQIMEEMTYKLFSSTEIYHHHKILAELIDLEISTMTAKTQFYKEMSYAMVMNRNEIRLRLGMRRGPDHLDEFLENKNFQKATKGGKEKDASEK